MYVPQELELNGIVRSSGNHPNDCGVELEFVEAKTGEVTFISEPGELAQLHCAKEKDFLVRLKAEKTSRFLFWGGGLKVLEFQVLQESEAQPHKQVQNSRESSFDRGDMRRLGR